MRTGLGKGTWEVDEGAESLNIGALEHWNTGSLKYFNIWTFEHLNI